MAGDEDCLKIRVRGKARLLHRAVLAFAVGTAVALPLLWAHWSTGPLEGSARALLVVAVGGLLATEMVLAYRLVNLCRDRDRKDVDRLARRLRPDSRVPQTVAGVVGTTSMVLLAAAGVAVLAGAGAWAAAAAGVALVATNVTGFLYAARFRARFEEQGPLGPQRPRPLVDTSAGARRPELAIACSGGGIRSAAFCLGALQRLRRPGPDGSSLYDRAESVYSVSGGGYVATGLHVARHASPEVAGDVFMPGSPEEDRLRRTSSYLLATARDRTLGIMSLLFGLVVNVILVASVLLLVAWWTAWWLRDSGALSEFATWFPQEGQDPAPPYAVGSDSGPALDASLTFGDLPAWVRWSPALVVLAAGAFVLHKVLVRAFHAARPPFRMPRWTAWLSGAFDAAVPAVAWTGLAAVVLLLGTPYAVATVSAATVRNQPTVAVASVTTQLGFASAPVCGKAAQDSFASARAEALAAGRSTFGYGACGKSAEGVPVTLTVPACRTVDLTDDNPTATHCAGFAPVESVPLPGGAAALLAAVTAITGAIMRAPRTLGDGRIRKGLGWLRTRLTPWIGAVLVVTAAAVGLLKITFDLTLRDPYAAPAVFDRTWLLWLAAAAIVTVKLVADATSASMHPFYRRRLSDTFLLRRISDGLTEPVPYAEPTLVSECPGSPGPGLVICGAANIGDEEFIPTQRECAPFRFATAGPSRAAEIGLSDHWRLPDGLRPAAAFEEAADPYRREATMAAAMAISGAAISPRTGRANHRSRPYRLLLALANARLGVWLPNPYWVEGAEVHVAHGPRIARLLGALARLPGWQPVARFVRTYVDKPGPFRLAKEAIGTSSVYDRRLYVTDGGHYDNTALVEALRDHPRHLILIDASNDEANHFSALADAVATARMDLGLEVVLDRDGLAALETHDGAPAQRAWVSGVAVPRGHRPDDVGEDERTRIDVVKAVLFEDLPLDLDSYRKRHPEFPRTSTGDQLYGEFDFEAYRRLGYEAMDRALEPRPEQLRSATVPTPAAPPVVEQDGQPERSQRTP